MARKDTDAFCLVEQSRYEFIDEHTSALRNWDLDVYQLDSGPYDFSELLLSTTDIQYIYLHTVRRVLNRAAASRPGFQFCFQLTEDLLPVNLYAEINRPAIWCIPAGSEVEVVLPNGFQGITLYLSDTLFYQWCDLFRLSRTSLPSGNEYTIYFPDERQQKRLIRMLMALKRLAQRVDPCAISHIQDSGLWLHEITLNEIAPLLFDVMENGSDAKYRARSETLLSAIRILTFDLDSPPSIEELAAILSTTPRNLQYLFRRHLGVTPKQFIQLYRLNEARRSLWKTAGVSGAVSNVANQLGYWHMGDFSRQFRTLFHKLPSDYLHRESAPELIRRVIIGET